MSLDDAIRSGDPSEVDNFVTRFRRNFSEGGSRIRFQQKRKFLEDGSENQFGSKRGILEGGFGPRLCNGITGDRRLEIATARRDWAINVGLRARPGEPLVQAEMANGRVQLVPANLLGALWLQFVAAIEDGKRFRRCPARDCPLEWFEVSTGPLGVRKDADFCSARCRHTAYRDRKSAARRMHRAGTPVNEIAKRLETSASRVRSWLKARGTAPASGRRGRPRKGAD